jgi:hypothetical protein
MLFSKLHENMKTSPRARDQLAISAAQFKETIGEKRFIG